MADEKKGLSHTPTPELSLKEKERRLLAEEKIDRSRAFGPYCLWWNPAGVPVHYLTGFGAIRRIWSFSRLMENPSLSPVTV